MSKSYSTYYPQNVQETDLGYKIVYGKQPGANLTAGGPNITVGVQPAPAAPAPPPPIVVQAPAPAPPPQPSVPQQPPSHTQINIKLNTGDSKQHQQPNPPYPPPFLPPYPHFPMYPPYGYPPPPPPVYYPPMPPPPPPPPMPAPMPQPAQMPNVFPQHVTIAPPASASHHGKSPSVMSSSPSEGRASRVPVERKMFVDTGNNLKNYNNDPDPDVDYRAALNRRRRSSSTMSEDVYSPLGFYQVPPNIYLDTLLRLTPSPPLYPEPTSMRRLGGRLSGLDSDYYFPPARNNITPDPLILPEVPLSTRTNNNKADKK